MAMRALGIVLCSLSLILARAPGHGAGCGCQQLPPRAAPTQPCPGAAALPVMDATPKFDAARATAGYLARVSGAARARSDAYFEGGYWLIAGGSGLGPGGRRGCCCGWAFPRASATGRRNEPTVALSQTMIYAAAYIAIVTAARVSARRSMKAISANMPMACRTRISWHGRAISASASRWRWWRR